MKEELRKDFPILTSAPQPFVYFDNAATTQKPSHVIDAISNFYKTTYATVHRSMYARAEKATEAFEQVRSAIAHFINASPEEIIFTKGATESINLVASSWGAKHLQKGDEIVLTELEHHSNLLPWQQLARKNGCILTFIPVQADGSLALENLGAIITKKTKFVSVTHVSNALGTHNDIQKIIAAAHAVGACILIDAAQSVPHQPIDVRTLNPDFLVFSGHKMLGPTGVGVLYAKKETHAEMPPYQFGGSMISQATYFDAQWLQAPHCYEAGTPPIAEVIGLGAALEYLKKYVNFADLQAHEARLCTYAIEGLQKIPGISLLGPLEQLKKQGHLVSFTIEGYHPHDVGAYLDAHGIAVRTGHYCAQPLARRLGINSSIRISFYCYNTIEEVEYFLSVIKKLKKH